MIKDKKYSTNIKYVDRESKSEYVFDKYQSILDSSVLDVGADAMHLKQRILSAGGKYCGIGYGEGIDKEVDLESLPYDFKDGEFSTVICLDVLEHLENIHGAFDELCRISSKYLIISLPNPWAGFFSILLKGDYSNNESFKFYGLPVDRPHDRHRWFFSEKEAKAFVTENGRRNRFSTIQIDSLGDDKKMGGNGLKGIAGRLLLKMIFRKDIESLNFHHGTIWFVLEKIT